jgi:hypothetical protein
MAVEKKNLLLLDVRHNQRTRHAMMVNAALRIIDKAIGKLKMA